MVLHICLINMELIQQEAKVNNLQGVARCINIQADQIKMMITLMVCNKKARKKIC